MGLNYQSAQLLRVNGSRFYYVTKVRKIFELYNYFADYLSYILVKKS